MTLFDKITEDIKNAMLAREKEKLESLRAIKAALLIARTEKSSTEMTPEGEIKILQKLVKQRRESAEIFTTQNRPELAEQENFEANIIAEYLPKQLTDAELEKELKEIMTQIGASSPADTGKMMGAASKQLAGRAEGKRIAQMVKDMLSSN